MAMVRHPFRNTVASKLVRRDGRFDRQSAPTIGHARLCAAALTVFGILAIDAARRPPGALDLATMKFVQRVDFPRLRPWLDTFERLTDSSGAVMAWVVTLAGFVLLRWWVPLLGVLAIPLGGFVNETISRVLIQRTRPHLDETRHVSANFEERSFPSGHVVGAVLLYGLLW